MPLKRRPKLIHLKMSVASVMLKVKTTARAAGLQET